VAAGPPVEVAETNAEGVAEETAASLAAAEAVGRPTEIVRKDTSSIRSKFLKFCFNLFLTLIPRYYIFF
jgi:hypothetical protein